MLAKLATVGNLQTDNVVAANGAVGVSVAGGNGGYSAVGTRLWAKTCVLAAHAPENFPVQWLRELERSGIETRGVKLISGFNPISSEWFFYQPDGTRRDLVFATLEEIAAHGFELPRELGASLQFDPSERTRLTGAVEAASTGRVEPLPAFDPTARATEIAALVADVQAIHLAPASVDMHRAMTKTLSAKGKLISLDPGHYVKNLKAEQLTEILQFVTIFAPSEREVFEFRGPCDLREAARDFAAMGPAIVVIKVGQIGALVYQRKSNTFEQVPAFPSLTLDPTGCGDSFCGGFLAGYVETGDAVEAARYGTIAASFTVEGFGVTYSLRFTRADAKHRLSILRAGVAPFS
jgi:ribokinase